MWPATAWDDEGWNGTRARGWTVMGRLRERRDMGGGEGPAVVALLFAHPDSDAIRMLDARGDYFDERTGDTWGLFFPGYYRSDAGVRFERSTGARAIGREFLGDWFFNVRDFNALRDHVERSSERRWQFSGGSDLVLIGCWRNEEGEPEVDWTSTISGSISDRLAGDETLTLAGAIERITRDLETAAEDPAYGVREVVQGQRRRAPLGRELIVTTLAEIAAALAVRGMGAT